VNSSIPDKAGNPFSGAAPGL